MLIIRGVNVFPSQIESVLMETPGVAPHYQLIVDREGQLDTLEVQVEVDEGTFSDEVKQLQALAQSIQRKIKDYFTVSVKVKLVEPQSIPRSEGKAKRVIDKRQLRCWRRNRGPVRQRWQRVIKPCIICQAPALETG